MSWGLQSSTRPGRFVLEDCTAEDRTVNLGGYELRTTYNPSSSKTTEGQVLRTFRSLNRAQRRAQSLSLGTG